MIREGEFNRAREVIRRSGLAVYLETRLRAGRVGASRDLLTEILLAACIVVFGAGNRTATLVQVHEVLTEKLVVSVQVRIGTRRRVGLVWRVITIRQVRYLFNRICYLLDFSPHTTKLTAQERAEREDAMFRQLNELIRASIPRDVPHADTLAVDATSMRTWALPCGTLPSAKGEDDYRSDTSAFARQNGGSWDPDARHGHQTKTHENASEMSFGHMAIASVGIHPPKSEFATLKLVETFVLTPNGYNVPKPTLRMLDEYRQAGHALGSILVDRGFSYWEAEGWARELLARRIQQTMDMHPADRGARPDPGTGVLMIDGWPYLPWTPKDLHMIPPPPRLKVKKPKPGTKPKKWATYRRNLAALTAFRRVQAELEQYALTPNVKPRPDGGRQFKVPQFARERATAKDRRTTVFRQPTVTVPGHVSTKLRQHYRWGSDAWIAEYTRRPSIEGIFGNLKARDGEGVQRGWIRVVGLVATALMTALAIVHYNLRAVRKWATRTGFRSDDILLQPDTEIAGYEEVPITDTPLGAKDPPKAA